MPLGGVHDEVGDQDVLQPLDRLAARVADDVPDDEVLEVVGSAGEVGELHATRSRGGGLRRRTRFERSKSMTSSSRWLKPSVHQVTMPLAGLLCEVRAARVVEREVSVSPG